MSVVADVADAEATRDVGTSSYMLRPAGRRDRRPRPRAEPGGQPTDREPSRMQPPVSAAGERFDRTLAVRSTYYVERYRKSFSLTRWSPWKL